MSKDIYEVTILGGGPTGMFAAFYAGMRELKTKIIEAAPFLGGKLPYYAEKYLYDVGGIAAVTAEDLAKELEKQAHTFSPKIVLSQLIEKMERTEDGIFLLTAADGQEHYTRAIIIAIGGGTLVSNKLALPEAASYEGRCLHYHAESLEPFRNKKVIISGGGDSAADWALALSSIASQTVVVHRREQFRAHEANVTKMHASKIQVITSAQITAIEGDGQQMQRVAIERLDKQEIMFIDADQLIVCHGVQPDLGEIKNWGLHIEQNQIVVDANMQTGIPGVFAAGDVVQYTGKLPGLIAAGFMEGPAAVNGVRAYLFPDKQVQPIWSTDHEQLRTIYSNVSE